MVAIAPVPILMNNAVLKVGADNYEKSVSTAKLTPVTPVAKFKGISGDTVQSAGKPAWTLTLTFAQDWLTVNSLSKYLNANAGTTKTIELTPSTGSTKATVTALIIDGDMGGDVDATTLATVVLEIVGQPAFA